MCRGFCADGVLRVVCQENITSAMGTARELQSFLFIKPMTPVSYTHLRHIPDKRLVFSSDPKSFPPINGKQSLSAFTLLALWLITAKNTDCSTGPLARPFARSLAPLTRSLAPDCSLRSRPPLRSLVRSLAH